jgi:phosphatidate cytidylyltransferase
MVPAELLTDPRLQPGSGYVALVLAALLVATLVAILAVPALRPGLDRGPLLRKWLTWAVLAPVFALACLSGPAAVALFVTVLGLLAGREYVSLVGLPRTHALVLGVATLVGGLLALGGTTPLLAVVPFFLFVGMLLPVVARDVSRGMRDLAFGALGFAYLPLLLAHAVLMVRDLASGAQLLLATGVAIAFSDIGAYLVGRTVGRHPLSAALSPNKTIEGVAGNVIGAAVGYLLFLPVLPAALSPLILILPLVVAFAAVWGDLFESALKREFGQKDAGAWLPGFGGLLDRIDSFILVVPVSYYVIRAADAIT